LALGALFATALWRSARWPDYLATALWRIILALNARDLFVLKKLTYEFLNMVMVN